MAVTEVQQCVVFVSTARRNLTGMKIWNALRAMVMVGTACVLLLASEAWAKTHKEYPFNYSDVDTPVSLGVGTYRLPEFPSLAQWYDIMIQVDQASPPQQMRCMMGVTTGPFDSSHCSNGDPLLQADWTVWTGEHIVARGSIPNHCACAFTNKRIYKLLGSFGGEAGKKYVVEVRFTKDGSQLDVANPRLFVIQHRHMW